MKTGKKELYIEEPRVKLHNKKFVDMTYEELLAEMYARRWHRSKTRHAAMGLERRLHWLKENKPILTKEELKRAYEDGELTKKQYSTAFATRKKAIDYRMRAEDYLEYARRIMFDEEAVITYIEELLEVRKGQRAMVKYASPGSGKYDPRKRASKSNPDPRRKWETRVPDCKRPSLRKARQRWNNYRAANETAAKTTAKMQPIEQWDVEKLKEVARDRGYFSESAVYTLLSQELGVSVYMCQKIMEQGKLSWGQCIVIGAVFEMTPREFCDVFLSGYFKEVGGKYVAKVDDTKALLDRPVKQGSPQAKEERSDLYDDTDNSNGDD